jgi:hypothetical protein
MQDDVDAELKRILHRVMLGLVAGWFLVIVPFIAWQCCKKYMQHGTELPPWANKESKQ